MNKLRSVLGVLIACLVLTNLVTQNSNALDASASTIKASARLEPPPLDGGIAIVNAPINPAVKLAAPA